MLPARSETDATETPRRFLWRRLVRFRLRTLFAFTAIVAAALAWWSHSARQQRDAIAALQIMDIKLEYDARLPGTGGMDRPPKWPEWLMGSPAKDYFANVSTLYLRATPDEIYFGKYAPIPPNVSAVRRLIGSIRDPPRIHCIAPHHTSPSTVSTAACSAQYGRSPLRAVGQRSRRVYTPRGYH